MAREWYLFFQALFLRSGGSSGPSNNDLLSLVDALEQSVTDLSILTLAGDQALAQSPIQELAELQKEVLDSTPSSALTEINKQFQDLWQSPALPSQVTPHLQYGSWTPTDASGAGLAFTVTGATYVKHERLVLARAQISYPVTANGSNASIGGLPFTVEDSEATRQGWISYADNATLRYFLPQKNATTASLYANSGAAMTNAQMSSTSVYVAALYTTPP
jgi:hypothetical protein